MCASVISSFKFAPITWCHVERSFSSYKHSLTLTDRRQNLTMENIEKYMVTYRCPSVAKKLHNLFVIKDINFFFFLDDSYAYTA
jgi:hypothetical protein